MPTYPETIRFYSGVMAEVLVSAQESLVERLGIDALRLTRIDDAALGYRCLHWLPMHESSPERPGNFNWPREMHRLRTDPKRFDLAIWHGTVLCGLAVGRPTPAKKAVGITLLEGSPDPAHPLRRRAAFIATETAQVYADALGAEQIRLMNPLPLAFELVYKNLGFVMASSNKAPTYCWREVP